MKDKVEKTPLERLNELGQFLSDTGGEYDLGVNTDYSEFRYQLAKASYEGFQNEISAVMDRFRPQFHEDLKTSAIWFAQELARFANRQLIEDYLNELLPINFPQALMQRLNLISEHTEDSQTIISCQESKPLVPGFKSGACMQHEITFDLTEGGIHHFSSEKMPVDTPIEIEQEPTDDGVGYIPRVRK